MAKPLIEANDCNGYLVMDACAWKRARANLREQTALFHAPQMAYLFSPAGHVKARSLAALADKIGVDAVGLTGTVSSYNAAITSGAKDEFGKHEDFRKPIGVAPFYAIDISIPNSPAYPAAAITLGGLVVDEATGEVVDNDGNTVSGLYAAGRAAVGICSRSYVSGLALADAVFSGRRAGVHAAARVTQPSQGV
jgi:3-oxo-5alpha-steroid 4-dehydrogenase